MLGDEMRQGDAWLRRRLDVAVRPDARFAGHLRAALAALVQAGRGDVRAIAVIMRLPSKYGAIMTGRS